jgi:hypothetical protein
MQRHEALDECQVGKEIIFSRHLKRQMRQFRWVGVAEGFDPRQLLRERIGEWLWCLIQPLWELPDSGDVWRNKGELSGLGYIDKNFEKAPSSASAWQSNDDLLEIQQMV